MSRTTDVALRYPANRREARDFAVAEFDAEAPRALDAGLWFVAEQGGPRSARAFGTLDVLTHAGRAEYASGRVRIPTLREALDRTVDLEPS